MNRCSRKQRAENVVSILISTIIVILQTIEIALGCCLAMNVFPPSRFSLSSLASCNELCPDANRALRSLILLSSSKY